MGPHIAAPELKLHATIDSKGFIFIEAVGTYEGQRQMLVEVGCDHYYAASASEVEPDAYSHKTRIRPYEHSLEETPDPTGIVVTIGDSRGNVLAKAQTMLFLR